MVVVTYSWVAPLLMPFGVLFYAFAYVMYKYQLLYVYINTDQVHVMSYHSSITHPINNLHHTPSINTLYAFPM